VDASLRSGFAARFAPETVIALGANRVCVVDPASPAHCLKFERPLHERTPAGLRERLRRRLGERFAELGDNHRELRAYRRMRRGMPTADALAQFERNVAACHDIVVTAHGPALRCDRVCDADGATAPSLYRCLYDASLLRRRYPAPALCAAVDVFETWLLQNQLPLFDLNSGNFAVIESQDGRPRLVCIDVKSLVSGKELLSISRGSPMLMRRKIARRAERLRQRIRTALAQAPTAD
jgi:PhoP regulatory network protein YrbL